MSILKTCKKCYEAKDILEHFHKKQAICKECRKHNLSQAPVTALEDYPDIEAEVQRRLKQERQKRNERLLERTVEQKAQHRAVKMLIERYPDEYMRIYERELIRVRTRNTGDLIWDAV